ncbi:Mitochondrial carrier protein, putative [Babesia bigemina]|uniref:Mitochondrial carrier protein, putative n=1 Tax=Babesia bigemina TaxID=5866 RepID=A0A061CZL1_BABBI|nr:Mitochondrial carrier protein, putative [Babesia bigemina]CDR94061.1 Mitochondrial carrier protein, putative [Babesia bigemina]|eukprot:XP_012766247.1 Mitochondrial carrier protein, putative [Babesia bigemina]
MESDDGSPLLYEEWNGRSQQGLTALPGDCKLWQHALCGSAAGVMEHLLLFPIDTLKTRLQCGWCKPRWAARVETPTAALESKRNVCSMSTTKSRFYQNLFRGCSAMAVGCIPAHVFYFTMYEALKKSGNAPIAGACATLCHDVVLTPADVIKQRLQLGLYRGSWHCLKHVVTHEGIQSLFRSLSVTLFMNVPYHTILVSVNDFLLRTHPGGRDRCGIATYFLYAGERPVSCVQITTKHTRVCDGARLRLSCIGGAVAGALTNPLDVIKTRLQTQGCYLEAEAASKTRYKVGEAYLAHVTWGQNPIDTARAIYRQHGFRVFWRGTGTRMMLCVPAAAISWGTYATLKNIFSRLNNG